eukprot:g25509.t2
MDLIMYNAAISAVEWRDAFALLEQLQEALQLPNVITYNAILAKALDWSKTLELLEEMEERQVEATLVTFNTLICSSEWSWALHVLQELLTMKLRPNELTYTAAMGACERGECWAGALALLARIPDPDYVAYGAAISACERRWVEALELLRVIQDQGLRPNLVICSAAMAACEKGEQWELALELLSIAAELSDKSPVPFNSAISACEKGSQWLLAWEVFHQMDHAGIEFDNIGRSALIRACHRAGQWPRVLELLDCLFFSRELELDVATPPPPGVSPHDLFRARGSIYGTKDAGRAWWKKLYKTLKAHEWTMSHIEPALFYHISDFYLSGILITHVDDLYCAGEGDKYEETISSMEKEIHLKVKRSEFRFCGKNIVQKNGNIEIDQYDAIEGIEYMIFNKTRRQQVNAPLNEQEKTQFRGLIGQMGWITRQSRPDLMVNVSMASQSMGAPKVKDVIQLNKAVKMLKETADAKWKFKTSNLKLEDCVVFAFTDSSFANTEQLKSQCGYVLGLTSSEMKDGKEVPIYILETYSGSVKRVCRSTLAAEANGFLAGAEAVEYVRMLLYEMINPTKKVHTLDKEFKKKKTLVFTDAKSLESTLNKDAGQPSDKRVKILCAQIKEMLGIHDYEDDGDTYAQWVDTSQMLADVLTKLGCEREPLLKALDEGQYRTLPTAEAQQKKLLIRAGRHARKQRKKADSEPTSPPRTGENLEAHEQGSEA